MRNKNFFMLPNRIFSLGLKPKEFAVYCCLIRHSDREKNCCFPSGRLIAQECNMDKKKESRQSHQYPLCIPTSRTRRNADA